MISLEKKLGYAAAAGATVYYGVSKYVENSRVEIVADQSGEGQRLISQCASLSSPHARLVPTPYLCSGMLQTVYCTSQALKQDAGSRVEY
ncbi:hypothetical protein LPJ70_006729, partial [Coemansia sp. RSA 2708]